jgi:hypothetical protein
MLQKTLESNFDGNIISVFGFYFFIYMYKGNGDSSGNAIPAEWAASLPV